MTPETKLFNERCKAACEMQIAITKPQLRLLFELAEGKKFVVDYYAPGKGLRNKGLAFYTASGNKIMALSVSGEATVRSINHHIEIGSQ